MTVSVIGQSRASGEAAAGRTSWQSFESSQRDHGRRPRGRRFGNCSSGWVVDGAMRDRGPHCPAASHVMHRRRFPPVHPDQCRGRPWPGRAPPGATFRPPGPCPPHPILGDEPNGIDRRHVGRASIRSRNANKMDRAGAATAATRARMVWVRNAATGRQRPDATSGCERPGAIARRSSIQQFARDVALTMKNAEERENIVVTRIVIDQDVRGDDCDPGFRAEARSWRKLRRFSIVTRNRRPNSVATRAPASCAR